MDPIFILALASFVAMAILWMVLPATMPSDAVVEEPASSWSESQTTSVQA